MKDRSDDPSHHKLTLLTQSYISLLLIGRERKKPILFNNELNTLYSRLVRRHRQKYHQNISLFEEIMKLGIWVGYPTTIILISGPNSETPPGGRHLVFQNGHHSEHINLLNSKTMIETFCMWLAPIF